MRLPTDKRLNCDFYFPTPIWWSDTSYDNTELLELFKFLKEDDPKGVWLSNFGGYQTRNFMPIDFPATDKFIKWIQSFGTSCLEDFGLNPERYKLTCGNIWFNENKGRDINQLHIRGGSFIAGTYYLKIPKGSGDIIFYRNYLEEFALATITASYDRYTALSGVTARYPPREGRVVLFPAWLQHGVLPSETEEPRISLAFNLRIEEIV